MSTDDNISSTDDTANEADNVSEDHEKPDAPLNIDVDEFERVVESDNPWKVHDDEYLEAAALMKESMKPKYQRVRSMVSDHEDLNANDFRDDVAEIPIGTQDEEEELAVEETTPDAPPKPEGDAPRWRTVANRIEELFDRRYRHLADAFMTVPVRMLFEGVSDCPIVIGQGVPSSGKSTTDTMFKDLHFTKSYGNVTEASWVSHNADAKKGEYDLLPRIKQRVMTVSEMGTWFVGENAAQYMRTLSDVADGNGTTRTTGAHGTTRYEADYPGEYRFGLIGSTVYPSKKAWVAMGNAGSRFLFHPMPKEDDLTRLHEMANEGQYEENKQECRDLVTQWWNGFWHQYDGEITEEDWPDISDDEDFALIVLARIISRGRAVDYGEDAHGGGVDNSEQELRAYWMLKRSVIAHALAYGRDEITDADLALAARLTFGSIPQWRQPVAKMLCHPDNHGGFPSGDVETELGVSRDTALARMKEAGSIGLADFHTEKAQGGKRSVITLADKRMRNIFENGIVPWPF